MSELTDDAGYRNCTTPLAGLAGISGCLLGRSGVPSNVGFLRSLRVSGAIAFSRPMTFPESKPRCVRPATFRSLLPRRSPVPAKRTMPDLQPPILVIHRNAVMRLKQLGDLMGIRGIGREVRAGRLRVHKIANRYYCLGSDILHWIEQAPAFGRCDPFETNGVHIGVETKTPG